MITINKKSLVHRFNLKFGIKDSWWWNNQTNLCPYFWGTIASIVKFIICSFFFVCVPTAFFSGLGYAVLGDMFGQEIWNTYWILSSPLVGILVILSLVLVALSIIGVVFGIKSLFAWCYKKLPIVVPKGNPIYSSSMSRQRRIKSVLKFKSSR